MARGFFGQGIEHDFLHIGAVAECSVEFRSASQRQHQLPGSTRRRQRGRQFSQQLQRGRVGPVQVFHRQQQRPFARLRQHHLHQRVDGAAALALRRQLQRRHTGRQRHVQQRGQQCRGVGGGVGLGVQLEPLQARHQRLRALFGAVLAAQAEASFQQRDDGAEGAALLVRRALRFGVLGAAVGGLTLHRLQAQRAQQARLADARFAAQQHRVAAALLHQGPARQQQVDCRTAADKGQQAVFTGSRQARLGVGGAQHAVGGHAFVAAANDLLPQWLKLKVAAHQRFGGSADGDGAGLGQRLHARGQVGRLASGQRAVLGAAADFTDHRRAAVHPNAQPHVNLLFTPPPVAQRLQAGQDVQCRVHRTPRVVFVRGGVAEIDQHAVAQVLRHVAVQPCHGLGTQLVIGAQQVAHVFGVELR